MSIEDHIITKEIDGYVYEITPVQAGVGQKALLRFLKLAAPVLSAAAQTGKSFEDAALDVISTVIKTISEEDLTYFTKLFGPLTRFCELGTESQDRWIRLTTDQQEMHFAARYMAMFDWLKECMVCNFGSFSDAVKTRAASVKAPPSRTTK